MTTRRTRQFDLDALLTRLGFDREATAGTHRVYREAATDTIVLLPADPIAPRMWQGHFQIIRRMATERGVVSEDCFDDMVDDIRAELKQQSQAAPAH